MKKRQKLIDELRPEQQEKRRANQQRFRIKLKTTVYSNFSEKDSFGKFICTCCKMGWDIACFNLDHINHDGESHRVSLYTKLGLKFDPANPPAGDMFLRALIRDGIDNHKHLIQLICANCHALKNAYGGMVEVQKIAREKKQHVSASQI